jgi:pimeloyl-ACP methyl ester carboxylesterase
MDSLILLVHSPLVGPLTWSLVAQQLRAGGFDALTPTLTDSGAPPPPYWRQHADCVRQALMAVPPERPLVLVGHSGAGPLLPVLAQAAGRPVSAYVFVDAGLPHPGRSQFEALPAELRLALLSGERFPNWSDADVRDELPDEHLRRQMLAQVQPRSLSYFQEVMPDSPEWPDAPSGYLLFTSGYRPFVEYARNAGWPSRIVAAGHFAMLVDPSAVSAALVELIEQMDEPHTR